MVVNYGRKNEQYDSSYYVLNNSEIEFIVSGYVPQTARTKKAAYLQILNRWHYIIFI
jgi:hypothetical protein